jgi:hypothetical protein
MANIAKAIIERNTAYTITNGYKNTGSLNAKFKVGQHSYSVRGVQGKIGNDLVGAMCFTVGQTLHTILFEVVFTVMPPLVPGGRTKTVYQLNLDLTGTTFSQPKAERMTKAFIKAMTKTAHDRMVNHVIQKPGHPQPPYLKALSAGSHVAATGLANYHLDLRVLFTQEFIDQAVRLRITYVR